LDDGAREVQEWEKSAVNRNNGINKVNRIEAKL
jgi:hypothetical protein